MRCLTPAAHPPIKAPAAAPAIAVAPPAAGTRADRSSVAYGDEKPVVALKDPRQEKRA